jgi:plastocyanin
MRTRNVVIIAVITTFVLLAGCGSSDSGESSGSDGETAEATALMDEGTIADESGQSEVTVDAVDNNFKPKYIEVSKGTAVNFVNEGRNVHNVLPVAEGAFTGIEADDFNEGDDGTITLDETGEFPYYCSLHGTKTKGMIGGVRVVD